MDRGRCVCDGLGREISRHYRHRDLPAEVIGLHGNAYSTLALHIILHRFVKQQAGDRYPDNRVIQSPNHVLRSHVAAEKRRFAMTEMTLGSAL